MSAKSEQTPSQKAGQTTHQKTTRNLHQANQFVQGDNQVWYDPKRPDIDFGYSDGQEIEQRLAHIFDNAQDLSSTSYELQSHISDWPTEYHLTPTRSNLLRVLDLSNVKRVLELGCGCGSITRYLGEQGIAVDAVEGSPIRAELAASRNRDLANVNISTANFNDINFPQDYYDLVLYVGVTEYAGRFSNGKSDEDALQDLLALAKKAATHDGVVFVAIENRTGMKYVMGANEDHYAKPYIGIHNYAQPAGIRTYTKKEWQGQIATAGFSEYEFLYPFPDYKIPTTFLAEDYVQDNPHCYSHLENNRSRDYVQDFSLSSKEALLWEAAAASGTLGDYANSFLILMSNRAESIAALSQYDFMHLPNYQRKAQYCMSIAKPKGEDIIKRSRVIADHDASQQATDSLFEHRVIENEPFHRGPLLSVEWARALVSYHDTNVFEQFLNEYWQYLSQLDDTQRSFDLLPSNIIVDVLAAKGNNAVNLADRQYYRVIDEEWLSQQVFSAEFIFYRATLLFFFSYHSFIEERLVKIKGLDTIGDWFTYAFAAVGQDLDDDKLFNFVQQNQGFQDQVSLNPGVLDFSKKLIALPMQTTLLWLDGESSAELTNGVAEYTPENSLTVLADGHSDRGTIEFVLPNTTRQLKRMQFFPCGDVIAEKSAFFRVYRVELNVVSSDGQARSLARTLWSLETEQAVAEAVTLFDAVYESGFSGSGFYVQGERPLLEWSIDTAFDLAADESLSVKIDLRYTRSEQYLQVKQRYIGKYLEQGLHLRQLEALHHSDQANYAALQRADNLLVLRCVRAVSWRARRVQQAVLHHAKNIVRRWSAVVMQKSTAATGVAENATTSTTAAVEKKKTLEPLIAQTLDVVNSPLLSIIIPFKDQAALLEQCINSIVQNSSYSNFEIIGVSNDSSEPATQALMQRLASEDSRIHFVEHNIPFNFSALVNFGVQQANGEYVVLLNNDIEIQATDWLEQLLGFASLDEVGAVGGQLLFPDGRVQHIGLHIDDKGQPVHTHKDAPQHWPQLAYDIKQTRRVSAVTGAMLMVSKNVYLELGGFNEQHFAIAFNDVDFGLRLLEQGFHNVYAPKALAIHHESVSRGYEDTVAKKQRFAAEQTAFAERHAEYLRQGDRYFPARWLS